MPYYYIDSLDADGGSAFVSLREDGLSLASLEHTRTAWHLAAPDFEPVTVASVAVGLAATARGHQLTLTVDGEVEVPFFTLDEVASFVRRLYLAGGGSGGDGAGPTPPPGPEGGSPSETPQLDGERPSFGVLEALGLYGTSIEQMSAQLDHREGRTAERFSRTAYLSNADHDLGADAIDLLRHAKRLVASALLDREPDANADARAPWLESAHAFWHLGGYTGVTPGRADETHSELEPLARFRPLRRQILMALDPLDLLSILPIPPSIAQPEKWDSVADLFFGGIANPGLLVSHRPGQDRRALLLLAALVLTSGGGMEVDARIKRDHLTRLGAKVRRALTWLDDQMPDHAFDPALETLLKERGRLP